MKLSIITINYNNLEGLKKTAESVLNQTWRDFEWIIVDGGSSDGSAEYIEQLASNLSDGSSDVNHNSWVTERFSIPDFTAENLKNMENTQHLILHTPHSLYWCSEPDKGIYNAMNKGIVMARGDYLNFMNSGDSFHDYGVLSLWNRSGLCGDVVYGKSKTVYKDHVECWQCPDEIDLLYLEKHSLSHQSMFIKRSLFSDRLYDEKLKIVSDWKAALLWFLEGKIFVYFPIYICKYDGYGMSSSLCEQTIAEKTLVLKNVIPSTYKSIILCYRERRIQRDQLELYYPELTLVKEYYLKRRLYRRLISWILGIIEKIDKFPYLQ